MGTDRELLEAAAKAAGLHDAEYKDMRVWGEVRYGLSEAMWSKTLHEECDEGYWNPLVDDAAALRLAVKLGLFTGSEFYHFRSLERFAGQDVDECTATRRAIVRAAAAIGAGIGEHT